MMNILFVSSKTGWGGVMSWMIQSSEGLQMKDHNVWIVSHPRSKLNNLNYPHLKSNSFITFLALDLFQVSSFIFLIFHFEIIFYY